MPRDKMFALRLSAAEKAEIEERAQNAGMSVSSYMIRCALGTLDKSSLEERLDQHERRLEALERIAELSY